uniref:BTB domain-containing protein n=1 Tax=Magallana gigas TaxID=29159 RepID=A0A8W8KEM3_MAGGI|nr:uncharacterized protein LOC105347006 [Crassostrea gigas]|eukprot:XP_019930393.1 PREDICTED: uncharacterized protein LOC105347006 [Crassostrea gigas]
MSSVSAAMPARKGILGTPLSLRQSDDKLSAVTSSRDFEKPRPQGEEKNPVPFVQEDGFSDIVLVVEGKRLYTSRSLLCMSSPVLARMLASPEQKDQREFPLQGKSYDTIHELLYILHPAYQRKVTDQTAFQILPIAEEYQIWNLKQRCEEILLNSLNMEKSVKDDQLLRCLQISDTYKLFALWTKCLQLCAKPNVNLATLQRNPEYEHISRFLKSMLEAFKTGVSETHRSHNDGSHVVVPRRGSTTLIDETNVRKTFVTSHTQTKF